MEEVIKKYVLGLLSKNSEISSLDNDESLILSHLLDSMDTMDLLFFLDEEFNVPVASHGGDFSELDTVNKIISYIARYRKHDV